MEADVNEPGEEDFEAPGQPSEHRLPKAKALATLLREQVFPYVRFVECRVTDEGDEVVVLDVEPEVPQHPAHDIRSVERLAVVFDAEDERRPDPLALRKDFPLVPHVNFRPEGEPRSLCLYDQRYAEQKSRWTAARFVRRIHGWLSQTARGELHEVDQPLEQLFIGSLDRIVLPAAFYRETGADLPQKLSVWGTGETRGQRTLIATPPDQAPPSPNIEKLPLLGFAYDAQPRVHGVLRLQPRTLAELHDYLAEAGEDLLDALRSRLRTWREQEALPLDHGLIILLRMPKRRQEEGPIEEVDVWAFATAASVLEVGEAVGLWEAHDGVPGLLIPIDESKQGEDIALGLLNPLSALTPAQAAALNGLKTASNERYVAIGTGALGSQVVVNLARAGQGQWTLVDEDQLLPHNLARHHLPGTAVGFPKAAALAPFLNSLYEEDIAAPVVANVLADKNEELLDAYQEADVLLDMSASVTVARHLALDVESGARRLSLFLSPDGTDLVLLAEPSGRTLRLDHLEMGYYWRLACDDALADHLRRNGEPVRYAHTCRDVSARLPQELVALHAAIGARATRNTLAASEEAAIRIWRASDDFEVSALSVCIPDYVEERAGDWTFIVSERVLRAIHRQRTERLPRETGGVLVGTFDTERRRIYVAGHIPSPPDSEEWPTAYVRGIEGLQETLAQIEERTAGQLEYVGEWHAHPSGRGLQPSTDDRKLFGWLEKHRLRDGFPPVMTIVGEEGSRWFAGDLGAYAHLSNPQKEAPATS